MIDDLRLQSDYCQATSPLYGTLFDHLANLYQTRVDDQSDPSLVGFFETVDCCWQDRKFIGWYERPLLLAGAIHEQVLQGHAPGLAQYYASYGGSYKHQQSVAFASALINILAERHTDMAPFLSQQCIQTNETSRGMAWLLPLLAHWRNTHPAVTLIELGCSAGLGLVADQYGYQIQLPDGASWQQNGAPSFDIELNGKGSTAAHSMLEDLDALGAAIQARIGCDLHPLDCRDDNQRRILEAFIWGDNAPRLARLRAAMKAQENVTQHGTLQFETGDMVECVQRLANNAFTDTPLICVFNTVATLYLDDRHYTRLRAAITAAFHGPWASKDCLWIEFEMPRGHEKLPEFTQGKETLIKVHSRDEAGGLKTQYFGAAKAHVTEIEVF